MNEITEMQNLVLAKLKEQGVTDFSDESQVDKALKDVVSFKACKRLLKLIDEQQRPFDWERISDER